jgi:hypothetical protein
MSGRYTSVVRFTFHDENAKDARIQLEPILTSEGYGVRVSVVLTLTAGTQGKERYEYERTVYDNILLQSDLDGNDALADVIMEFMEGWYYVKSTPDVVVPVCAIILEKYFTHLLEVTDLDLSTYIVNIDRKSKAMGFKNAIKRNTEDNT